MQGGFHIKRILSKHKNAVIIAFCVLFVVSIFFVYNYWKENRWRTFFEISYIDYFPGDKVHPYTTYYLYEIRNLTNETFDNLYATVYITQPMKTLYQEFEFNDYVAISIRPGETVEYRIYWADVKKEAEKRGIELYMSDASINNLHWNE